MEQRKELPTSGYKIKLQKFKKRKNKTCKILEIEKLFFMEIYKRAFGVSTKYVEKVCVILKGGFTNLLFFAVTT